jgi:hypothetical protein
MDLRDSGSLARGYCLGNVVSFKYDMGEIPEDSILEADFDFLVGLLEKIQKD